MLSEPMRRELLWLAIVCDERGHVDTALFDERRELFEGDMIDLGQRYRNLERVGYVDTVGIVWDGGIGIARVTEEGRFAAKEILAADLESSHVPESVKESVLAALAESGISAAAGVLSRFLGLM